MKVNILVTSCADNCIRGIAFHGPAKCAPSAFGTQRIQATFTPHQGICHLNLKRRRPDVCYQHYAVAPTPDDKSREQAVQAVIRMLGVEALDSVAGLDRLPATGAGCVRQDAQLET